MPTGVTPAGIRAGEPSSLAGLVELRGRAVRAYAGAVARPDGALAAAAEAMASFRAHVVQATDVRALDPDALLLRASRESSAARAPRPAESGATLRRLARRGDSPCELAPRLLAARANRELSHEDAVRLDRHLASCPTCRDLRERFRTAENLYAEGAGAPLVERDARALLIALARAGPLAEGTPESITDEALALLSTDAVRRPVATRPAAAPAEVPPAEVAEVPPAEVAEVPPAEVAEVPPAEVVPPAKAASPDPPPVDTPPPSAADAPPSHEPPADAWPGNVPSAVDDRPAQHPAAPEAPDAQDGREGLRPNGAGAAAGAPAAHHGAGVGTTQGRVSFARRTVIIRTGVERSAPAAPPPSPSPSSAAPPAAARPPVPPAEPRPAEHSRPQAAVDPPAPEEAPARPEQPSNRDSPEVGPPVLSSAAPTSPLPPSAGSGPGAPPDSGTLARIVPGLLIVMAIGIALLIAGILGPGRAPATSDDIEPPGLREPVSNQDATGPLPTPAAPGTEAAALAD